MAANYKRPPRFRVDPEVVQLSDETWLVRRLGLCGLGPDRLQAMGDLSNKEALADWPPGLPLPQLIDPAVMADVVRGLFPEADHGQG
jgi:hypothetical protein